MQMRKLVLTVVPVLVLAFSAGGLAGCENKWVKRAEAIEKAACACKDAKCAKEQHKALREYIKDARKVKVKKSDAKKVGKAVTKASKCIYTIQSQSLRKKSDKK
jgi:uncharacterized membrane protein